MRDMQHLNQLRETGRMRWMGLTKGWIAEADEVVAALASDGFQECKHEEAHDPHYRARSGLWQGVNPRTGVVASAVWTVSQARPHLVFIDIDGEPLREP